MVQRLKAWLLPAISTGLVEGAEQVGLRGMGLKGKANCSLRLTRPQQQFTANGEVSLSGACPYYDEYQLKNG